MFLIKQQKGAEKGQSLQNQKDCSYCVYAIIAHSLLIVINTVRFVLFFEIMLYLKTKPLRHSDHTRNGVNNAKQNVLAQHFTPFLA